MLPSLPVFASLPAVISHCAPLSQLVHMGPPACDARSRAASFVSTTKGDAPLRSRPSKSGAVCHMHGSDHRGINAIVSNVGERSLARITR